MHKRSGFALVLFILAGCGTSSEPHAKVNAEPKQVPRAEYTIGGDQDEAPHLPFRITAIHEQQTPTPKAPFHANGGEWTFLDCEAGTDPKAAFTVGTLSKKTDEGVISAWG